MKKLYVLFLFVLFICAFSFVSAKSNTSNLKLVGKVIYLDAGHGGLDPGSVYKNIYEKDINLQICKKLQALLEQEGAIVYQTRYDDYDLASNNSQSRKKSDLNNRVKVINESRADMYISIHLNFIESSTWSGAQVFYDDANKNNSELALIIQKELRDNLKTTREVKQINNILLNRKAVIPGVLIEAGFLSNPNDRYLLRNSNYQYKVAQSIKNGIIRYFYK